MKLVILGSGTFFVNKDVSASSFILETEDKKILIDCGPGTLMKLSQAGIDVKEIDYVFITHLHPDHSSDLFPLFMNFRLTDIFAPGTITKYPVFYGPEGLHQFLVDYSHITQLHAVEGWNKIKMKDYTPKIVLEDLVVKTFKVEHKAFDIDAKAFALRFEINKKVIVFSGDSAKCKGIQNACKDADLFICDSTNPADQPVNNIHMNTSEIAEISQSGKVKKIVLDHFYPQFSNYDLVKEVKEGFKGDVIKAKDLDIIDF
jgi:ribonuclease BN (tRNA processing enzyme)